MLLQAKSYRQLLQAKSTVKKLRERQQQTRLMEDTMFGKTWQTELSGFDYDVACLLEPGSRAIEDKHGSL